MRTSQYFLGTFKEKHRDTEMISYQLMLRAGLIRKVASGLYMWLPIGLRVLHKLKSIIREEMNRIGAIEVCLPIVQPAKLWKMSGRWTQYGSELLRFKNRNSQDFILSPTHEELIADIISKEIFSYRQLPLILYQIQNKFRDEMRPRFGMIRSREFIMKDGYSFHMNHESLEHTYDVIHRTYEVIFNKLNINFRVIKADSGNIGGNISHEFHAIANHGEDLIVCSTESRYTASIDLSKTIHTLPMKSRDSNNYQENMRLVKIDDVTNIIDLLLRYKIPKEKFIQTFIVRANKSFGYKFLAILIRFDHELNYAKLEKLPQVHVPLSFANDDEIYSLLGVSSSIVLGPINLPIPMIADHNVVVIKNFISGANVDKKYFFGVNWGRDLPFPKTADLRKVISKDRNRDSSNTLQVYNSIEIGHTFQLGDRYLRSLSYNVQGEDKKSLNLLMGCYGIGVSRLIAAVIEQNHDEFGIIWPDILAPFFLAIIPINMYRSYYVSKVAEKLYNQFSILKIDVLLDDRDESAGVKFSDIELIGIPHSIIISDRNVRANKVEYRSRNREVIQIIDIDEVLDFFSNGFCFDK